MKVTIEQIESKIKGETYLVLPDGKSTLCILDLENGYTIKGLSACVDPKEFNLELGRKYAREEAVRQIWPLEGYLLAEKLNQSRIISNLGTSLKKAIHWTHTPEGKRKLAARKKARK